MREREQSKDMILHRVDSLHGRQERDEVRLIKDCLHDVLVGGWSSLSGKEAMPAHRTAQVVAENNNLLRKDA